MISNVNGVLRSIASLWRDPDSWDGEVSDWGLPVLFIERQKGGSLTLDVKNFSGSIEKAMNYLQAYCNKNDVSTEPLDFGYTRLSINGVKHLIPPSEFRITKMLELCGGKTPEDFPIKKG